jgi:hypothetical protein
MNKAQVWPSTTGCRHWYGLVLFGLGGHVRMNNRKRAPKYSSWITKFQFCPACGKPLRSGGRWL